MKNQPRPNATSGNRRHESSPAATVPESSNRSSGQRPLEQRMELRKIVIEVLVPGSEEQDQRIGHGMQLAQQIVPEGAEGETELRERGIARMAPGPSSGEKQNDPERWMA